MFEFEDDSRIGIVRKKKDDYDLELGIAISKSLMKTPGMQIRDPKEIKEIIDKKIKMLVKKGDFK